MKPDSGSRIIALIGEEKVFLELIEDDEVHV
jgi:hypothetical protein